MQRVGPAGTLGQQLPLLTSPLHPNVINSGSEVIPLTNDSERAD